VQVRCDEGVAVYIGPEPSGHARKDVLEASSFGARRRALPPPFAANTHRTTAWCRMQRGLQRSQ